MNDFVYLCGYGDLEEGTGKKFNIEDTELVLLKHKGIIHALSNFCPHHHVSIMHEGLIENDSLLCPNHFWKFEIATGKKEGRTKGLEKYDVKIIENKVYVKITRRELNW